MITGAQLRLVVRPQPQEYFVGAAAGDESWGGLIYRDDAEHSIAAGPVRI